MATTAGRHRLACLAYGTGLFGRAVLQKEFFERHTTLGTGLART